MEPTKLPSINNPFNLEDSGDASKSKRKRSITGSDLNMESLRETLFSSNSTSSNNTLKRKTSEEVEGTEIRVLKKTRNPLFALFLEEKYSDFPHHVEEFCEQLTKDLKADFTKLSFLLDARYKKDIPEILDELYKSFPDLKI